MIPPLGLIALGKRVRVPSTLYIDHFFDHYGRVVGYGYTNTGEVGNIVLLDDPIPHELGEIEATVLDSADLEESCYV